MGDSEQTTAASEETLDPADWDAARALVTRVAGEAVDHLRDIRSRPVWRDMPPEIRTRLATKLPHRPTPLEDVVREVFDTAMAYPMGNTHPRFWAWYMGAGNLTGALGEFLAAVQGSNLGGGNHAAARMDDQVVGWLKEMVNFPSEASGTLTSGGSMANLIGLTVARNVMAEVDVRAEGMGALPQPLRFYASDQVHGCHFKAVEGLGLGRKALRLIPTTEDFRIDLTALRTAIAEDRAAGLKPACIIGTAGTVNVGAIDDLNALADLAAVERMWFHIDGCIGALIAIAPVNAPLVTGLERADSIAMDPHKWLHAPFEAGCALIRDSAAHRDSFAHSAEYLQGASRGLAAAPWLHDLGPQTSRGFRALKVWMALKEHGVTKFGRLIDQNIAQAKYLADLINQTPELELAAPTYINIVCFRHLPKVGMSAEDLKRWNVEIMLRLQEEGIAVFSDTTLNGRHCLRVAITNHRTRRADLDLLVKEILAVAMRDRWPV